MRHPSTRTLGSSMRGLFVASAAVLLVGCSAEQPQGPAPAPAGEQTVRPSPTGEATNTPADPTADDTAAGAVSETIVCRADGPPPAPFTGPAATEFGADAVLDAYCESGAFFVQHAITNLTDPASAEPQHAVRDLRFVADRLTVRAAQRWHRTAAAADASIKHQRALSDLTYYRLPLPAGYAYPDGGPMAVGGTVSTATADVATLPDGRDALALWYSVGVDLPLARDTPRGGTGSATHVLPLQREVALYLVPNPDPQAAPDLSWLIESWTSSWEPGPVERWSVGR